MKSGPSKSPSPAPQPSVDEAAQLPVIRDDDSLFEGDAGSLFGGDDEPQAFSRAPSHTNSLFVGEDEPVQTQPSRPAAPAEDRRSPFRDSNGTIPHEPVAASEQDGTHGSVCGGNVEAAQSMLAFSDGRRGTREPTSSFHGDDEPAKAPSAPSVGEDAVHSSPAQGSIATPLPRTPPATASQRTHIECELATMADEVRRWEAVRYSSSSSPIHPFLTPHTDKLAGNPASSNINSRDVRTNQRPGRPIVRVPPALGVRPRHALAGGPGSVSRPAAQGDAAQPQGRLGADAEGAPLGDAPDADALCGAACGCGCAGGFYGESVCRTGGGVVGVGGT